MSTSDDQKRDQAIEALRNAPTSQDKNARAGIVKQKVRDSFVFKVLNGQEPMNRLTDYIDMWTPESMMQLHDFLGFSEKEWLMIVADQRAYPYIIQERAFQVGKLPMTKMDQFNYQKLLEEIAPRGGNIETIVKSAMDPEAVFSRLVKNGTIDKVPNHLFVHYKAHGWMTHKLFIDLNDIANLKFRWDVLDASKVAETGVDKVVFKAIEAKDDKLVVDLEVQVPVIEATVVVEKTDEKKS